MRMYFVTLTLALSLMIVQKFTTNTHRIALNYLPDFYRLKTLTFSPNPPNLDPIRASSLGYGYGQGLCLVVLFRVCSL